jgi:hypothetical protein
MAAALFASPALAHEGDHTAMTAAQVAHHIVTSPDHLAELVIASLFVLGGAIRLRRRSAR